MVSISFIALSLELYRPLARVSLVLSFISSNEVQDGDSVRAAVTDLQSDVTAFPEMLMDVLARITAPSVSIQSASSDTSKLPVR